MRLVLDNDVLCRGDVDGAGWRHLESRGRPHADSPIAELRGATVSGAAVSEPTVRAVTVVALRSLGRRPQVSRPRFIRCNNPRNTLPMNKHADTEPQLPITERQGIININGLSTVRRFF